MSPGEPLADSGQLRSEGRWCPGDVGDCSGESRGADIGPMRPLGSKDAGRIFGAARWVSLPPREVHAYEEEEVLESEEGT